MLTLEDLQSEMALTLDMVRSSRLDTESKFTMAYKLGGAAISILIIQSMVREAESLLREAQELARIHSSSQERH